MSRLQHLMDDERGTAMTEFVITLPVFLTIFLGILGLHHLQHVATSAHPIANRIMWENVLEVAHSEPTSKWGDPSQFEYDAVELAEKDTLGYDEAKFMRIRDYGTLGEAVNGAQFEESQHWRWKLRGSEGCAWCMYEWKWVDAEISPNTDGYALFTHWDQGTFSLSTGSYVEPELARFKARVPDRAKSFLAHGAGTRYGIVYGQEKARADWYGIGLSVNPTYQVVAPARALETDVEAFDSVGIARVTLEYWEQADLPGFEMSDEFYAPGANQQRK